tara:strand:- start:390 stop:650 length:261 start_codon:yes stop_codon:yes gene_type:complete
VSWEYPGGGVEIVEIRFYWVKSRILVGYWFGYSAITNREINLKLSFFNKENSMSEASKKGLARDVIAEEIAEYRKVVRFSLHLGLA